MRMNFEEVRQFASPEKGVTFTAILEVAQINSPAGPEVLIKWRIKNSGTQMTTTVEATVSESAATDVVLRQMIDTIGTEALDQAMHLRTHRQQLDDHMNEVQRLNCLISDLGVVKNDTLKWSRNISGAAREERKGVHTR